MALILDTRFLITHTFPPSENIRKKIKEFTSKIAREELFIPSIVITEFIKIAGYKLGRESSEIKLKIWLSEGVKVIPLNEELAFLAGRMALSHANIPICDVIIGTIAKHIGARIVTDDPHFIELDIKTLWYE
ncbi:MAG: PIN domain-containing protein [Nitrososphaerota archaeon]